jgi:hypothetical protein
LEHTQRDAVIEYLQMPEKVRNIEGEVAALRGDVSQLTSALRQVFDLEGDGKAPKGSGDGGKSYVS